MFRSLKRLIQFSCLTKFMKLFVFDYEIKSVEETINMIDEG